MPFFVLGFDPYFIMDIESSSVPSFQYHHDKIINIEDAAGGAWVNGDGSAAIDGQRLVDQQFAGCKADGGHRGIKVDGIARSGKANSIPKTARPGISRGGDGKGGGMDLDRREQNKQCTQQTTCNETGRES